MSNKSTRILLRVHTRFCWMIESGLHDIMQNESLCKEISWGEIPKGMKLRDFEITTLLRSVGIDHERLCNGAFSFLNVNTKNVIKFNKHLDEITIVKQSYGLTCAEKGTYSTWDKDYTV